LRRLCLEEGSRKARKGRKEAVSERQAAAFFASRIQDDTYKIAEFILFGTVGHFNKWLVTITIAAVSIVQLSGPWDTFSSFSAWLLTEMTAYDSCESR
jgi:hypothetical protein